MNKVYYLSTCNTCTRIMKEVGVDERFEQQDVKHVPVSREQLEELREMAGSYEALFNRRSRQFVAKELKGKTLGEEDYRDLILEEYTFLKRPVFVCNGQVYIGNAKGTVDALRESLHGG